MDEPLHPQLAEPALAQFLLAQSRTTQDALAKTLETTQQRLSRVSNGKAELSASEFVRAAPSLALGEPTDLDRQSAGKPVPVWMVTRWHASGLIEPPPVTRDRKLPVFLNFREAELTIDYLRCFSKAGVPVAVPVWQAWLHEVLATRGFGPDAVQMLVPPGGTDMDSLQQYIEEFEDAQRGLLWALIAGRGQ